MYVQSLNGQMNSNNNSVASTTPNKSITVQYTNTLEFESFLQFKQVLQNVLDNCQFQNEWVAIITKILGPNNDIVLKKCSNEDKEILALLKPGSHFFRILTDNFSNDTHQFYFPFERLPKSIVYELTFKPQSLSPRVINQINITEYKRDVIVNMFQYYFFAFGLFSDHLNSEMTYINSGSCSNENKFTRTIHGIPTFSHNRQTSIGGNKLSNSTSSTTASTSSTTTPISPLSISNIENQQQQKARVIYLRLLLEYLDYFLPFSRNMVDGNLIIDPSRLIVDSNQRLEMSITFFKIISESLLGHNLLLQSLNGLNQFYYPLLSQFKKPTIVYLSTIQSFLTYYQCFAYSFNYISPFSTKQITPTIELYFKTRDIVSGCLFRYLVSFFERLNPNDKDLQIDKVLNLWIGWITPWDENTLSSRRIAPKNLQKTNSITNLLNGGNGSGSNGGNGNILQLNQDYHDKWNNFIIENFYFYSYIFNLLLIRSQTIDVTSYIYTFKNILSIFNSPVLKNSLKQLSNHDISLMNSQNQHSINISKDTLNKLNCQIEFYGIQEFINERNLFSEFNIKNATRLVDSLYSKIGLQNISIQKEYYEIIKKLCNFYDIEEPTTKPKPNLQQQLQTTSTPQKQQQQVQQGLLSPVRNTDGTLSDLGRKQIYDGKVICKPSDTNYPYETLISKPLVFERQPITSDEIGILIKLGYKFTSNSKTRQYIRKLSRKRILYTIILFLFLFYFILKIYYFFKQK